MLQKITLKVCTFKNNSCGVVYLHASCGVFYQQIPQGRQRVTPCIASSSQFSNRHGVGSVEDDNQCIRFGLGVSELGEHWQQKRCEEMGLIDLLLRQRRM